MEARKKYCFDIDGVVADFNNRFADLLESLAGGRIPRPHDWPNHWDWAKHWNGPDIANRAWRFVEAHPEWWYTLECRISPKSKQRLEVMAKAKNMDICFLTSRSLCPVHISTEWIKEHIGPYGVTSVAHYSDKLAVIKGLKPTAYIDDHAPTIDMMKEVGLSDTRVYLADQPYNVKQHTIDIDTFIYEAANGRI